METTYFADGFAAVDQTQKQHIYEDCLNYIDAVPYIEERKTGSYELLKLSEAEAVLDIGCGVGSDVLRMVRLIGEEGLLTMAEAENTIDELQRQTSDHTFMCSLTSYMFAAVKAL